MSRKQAQAQQAPTTAVQERRFRKIGKLTLERVFPLGKGPATGAPVQLHLPQVRTIPETWGQCKKLGFGTIERPCPHLSCEHHLALELRSGRIVVRGWSEREGDGPEEGQEGTPQVHLPRMSETCELRVMEQGGVTVERIAEILGVRENFVKSLQADGLRKLRSACEKEGITLEDFMDATKGDDR